VGAGVGGFAVREDAEVDGSSGRRKDHRHVVDGAAGSAAGLVGKAPGRRQTCTDAGGARSAGLHPGEELLAAGGREGLRFHRGAQQEDHGFRRRRVAGIAGEISVQLRLHPVEASEAIAQAPDEGELPGAAQWSLRIPSNALDGLSDVLLQFRYQGDVARLYAGNRLLSDDFFNGLDWPVGLKHLQNAADAQELRLSILPLRKDAPVYFELPYAVEFDKAAQAARLGNVRLIPEYELVLGGSKN